MAQKIVINPITRLEGHGRIDILLDDEGNAENAFVQVPEFRGFERFCRGRAAEEMPTLTQKICGVCPTAHHMAATKALDSLFHVTPPDSAKKIRELMYAAFMFEDHVLHFYMLGGPDFLVGPDAPKESRNVLGVIGRVGQRIGRKVLDVRRQVREINGIISGSPLYPVCGLPGGISRALTKESALAIRASALESLDFAQATLRIFDEVVLKDRAYADLLLGDVYNSKTYYMGMVDDNNKVNFYDGRLRVVDPEGNEVERFAASEYLDHLEERVVDWSYAKPVFLKKIGWKGFVEGRDSGIFRVAPLARLNVASGMATPIAHAEYERLFDTLGGRPSHNTLAYHWARLVEVIYAAERMVELAHDPELLDPCVRRIPVEAPTEGVGVVEAARGTLIHHYKTDEKGILTDVNLIVATQNNTAAIGMSVLKAAKGLISGGKVSDGILNRIEMAFRAYDPCLACTTHSLSGEMPLIVSFYNHRHELVDQRRRD